MIRYFLVVQLVFLLN